MAVLINTTKSEIEALIRYARIGANNCMIGHSWEIEEVVRCENCRWGRETCGNIECVADMNVPPEYHGYDWYCPNGERRGSHEID